MFLSEDGLSIASIPSFRVDIPLSSESIQFGAEITRMESDDKIKLRKVLRLPHLPLDQYLGSRKILKVCMICNNVDGIDWTFQIVLPNLESFKDGKQFLVMYVVIQLHCSESAEVKSNQMNFIIFINNREDCSKSIVQSISFHNELCIGNLMSENRSGCECLLERVKSIMTGRVKLPRNVLLGKAYQ